MNLNYKIFKNNMEQRVIFDTSIYPLLVDDKKLSEKELEEFQLKIKSDKSFQVFGINIIRRELKNTFHYDPHLLRILLKVYELIKEKEYDADRKIVDLAEKYYENYKSLKGRKSYKELETDLMIVACATLKNVDIVVLTDRETMSMDEIGKIFREAYHNVNVVEGHRDSNFWQYKDLKLRFGFFKKEP